MAFRNPKTRRFASFLMLADLGGLRRDFLKIWWALSSVGRLPGSPDLHHPCFLHRYKSVKLWGRTSHPTRLNKEGVEVQLVRSLGVAFGCSAGVVASLLSQSPHLLIRGQFPETRQSGWSSLFRTLLIVPEIPSKLRGCYWYLN